MHSLSPLTALGSDTPRIDEFDGVTLTEVADKALASIALRHGKKSAFGRACKTATGMAPPSAGTFTTSDVASGTVTGGITLMATGLDQWMAAAAIDSHELLAAHLASTLKATASVTEQNDGWVWFDLDGPQCVPVFERLCAANSRAMTSGDITRTAIDHLGCFVLCHEAGTRFSVLGPRSSAQSLHHAIITAIMASAA